MYTTMVQSLRPITLLCSAFLLLLGLTLSQYAHAENAVQKPMQLAVYIGFHQTGAGGYLIIENQHQRNYFWTEWRYVGRGCEKSCLINRWTGEVIRCERRCY